MAKWLAEAMGRLAARTECPLSQLMGIYGVEVMV
jgi:hypothetical protein